MHILVLNGSPKKNSDTMKLTEAFLRGMEKHGGHHIEVIHVIDKEVKPCIGCFACWKIQNGRCIQQDDQNAILEKIIMADVVIWSFPLYCYGMPSHLKAVADRTIPLLKMSMTEADGVVRHDRWIDLSSKHTVVISGGGFPEWSGNFEGLRAQCRHIFFDHGLTMICVPETPLLNAPSAAAVAQPLLARFEEAGAYYTEHLCLSREMTAVLETPMLPNEAYIRIVNEQ